ncbi:bifunctional lysylphosphatidylglycerol synthetase/lysine--tRNA ligase LysX [Corynebacterium bovis]|uniref:bifunctional lysylphosphatidylglycerol synthetase/lysine--tRNA ligase LysX n=1 Tax=Corynebacterium bovis TaxID=36808 RepID=UPI000F62FC07|nr:bifunctional lysylphosphatidylglycerol synthetase/lysine--tRNA ligase LysX [Corynebacterium bovis]MDN8578483.1 bifunctional lysylphosphatidylglycerol synthetase/lysine--tRNA ligase LysX [Corynebacterium bovis]RRO89771.1 lysine--tRNA ligase [Corynebacterium bovis]
MTDQVPAEAPSRVVPRILGVVVCCYALLGLVLSVAGGARRPLGVLPRLADAIFLPLPAASVAWAVALFLLGGALLAGKRAGWIIATVGMVVLNLVNVLTWLLWDHLDLSPRLHHILVVATVVQGLMLVVLLAARRSFPAKTRPGAVRRAILTWAVGSFVVFLLGSALVTVAPGTLTGAERFGWVLNHAVTMSLVEPGQFVGRAPRWETFLISAASAVVIVYAVWTMLRSKQQEASLSATDDTVVRAMIARFNRDDSLAYFATRRDKSVIYSPDGRAAITYRVVAGVSLASADPIGDPAAWGAAVAAWIGRSREYGWTPAVMGASEAGARVYTAHGLSAMRLGDEAVLHPESFHLGAPEFRAVRQAVSRARRAGVTIRVRRHEELTPAELRAVQRRADMWRDTTDERGFSMALSRLGDPSDGECVLVEALIEGEVVAELSFVPWGRDGLSLDLMRRSPGSPNGTIEAMVAELCTNTSLGVRRISLNFSVFRQIFATESVIGTGPATVLLRRILVFFSRWWQMEALYRSNEKYSPEWVPRFMCFGERVSLLRTAFAAGIAEGFVPAIIPADTVGTSSVEDHSPGAEAALARVPAWQEEATTGVARRRPVSEQVGVRIAAAESLRGQGVDPWPVAVRPDTPCARVAELPEGTRVRVSGRIVGRRRFGGVSFLVLRDFDGECQALIEQRHLPDAADRVRAVDLADLVQVTGTVGRSRSGHPSVIVDGLRLEAKALHPLPDKRHGLTDPELRLRHRHLDMVVNPQPGRALRTRSEVLHAVRSVLHDRGYLEVETPILQQVHGGANARPFRTHINAHDLDLYLRIAPELFLKRLMCGGAERIFELGRDFRNEGVDSRHNPEFTVLEAYEAHGDYRSMMELTRELIQAAATAVHGRPVVTGPDGDLVDISGEWPVRTVHGAVSEALTAALGRAVEVSVETPEDDLRAYCEAVGTAHRPGWDAGKLTEELYSDLVEAVTTTPTFYVDFPESVSPLTRPHRSTPGLTERWDLVAYGMELGTAYSELTDPLEQRRRLEAQSLLAAGGDPEAMEVDEDFLRALEFGMPPTGGLGIGIDRVIMLIGGGSIRDVLAFPLVKGV